MTTISTRNLESMNPFVVETTLSQRREINLLQLRALTAEKQVRDLEIENARLKRKLADIRDMAKV